MNKINYNVIKINNIKDLEDQNDLYWFNAPIEEHLKETVYLRECMYGKDITARKLKRVCRIAKQA